MPPNSETKNSQRSPGLGVQKTEISSRFMLRRRRDLAGLHLLTHLSLTKSEILTPGNPNGLAKPPDQPISFDSLACENGGRRNSDCSRSCLRRSCHVGAVLGYRRMFVPVVLPLSSAAVAQLVEHNVANVVVVGSNPISRSSQAFPHFQGCELDVHVRNH